MAHHIHSYLELTKPKITLMALITTAVGFLLATSHPINIPLFACTLIGAWLTGSGANSFNEYLERHFDSQMQRTQNRPLPRHELDPKPAAIFSLTCSALGILILLCFVGIIPALLALGVLVTYLALYTPLKRHSAWCTVVGAIPGAIPPMIGVYAVAEIRTPMALFLFLILFFWQLPHFYALAWLYKEDYATAGFCMLSVNDASGDSTAHAIILTILLLICASALPLLETPVSFIYGIGLFALGTTLLLKAYNFLRDRNKSNAKKVFMASNFYLLGLLLLLVIDFYL